MSSVLRKTKRRSAICKVIERSFSKAENALAETTNDPTQIASVLAYRDTIVEKFQVSFSCICLTDKSSFIQLQWNVTITNIPGSMKIV